MKISEVSEKYALSADTLRYYERVGMIPPVNRTDSGIRDYNELDLRRVEFVKCMRRRGIARRCISRVCQIGATGRSNR